MPEREKDDELDAEDLEKGSMLMKVTFKLDVELDEAVHGDCDGRRFEGQYPDMGKGRTE